MDVSIDSSKLPDIPVNPAVPVVVSGKEPRNDIFNTYSLLNIDHMDHPGDDILFRDISETANWENNLSTNNSILKDYLSGKPIFHEKKITTEIVQPVPQLRTFDKPQGMNNFIISVLIFCFILLAWLKYNFPKYLQQISHSIINYSESVKLHHDHNALIDRVYFILNLIFIFTCGLLIYNFLDHNRAGINDSTYIQYMLSCLFIFVLVSYRSILAKLSGYILKQQNVFDEYNHSNLLFFKASGVILLPLTAFMSFVNAGFRIYLLYFSLGVLILFFVVSIFRGTRIMLQKGVLLFYWILYLCTIEIIPLLLLLKYLNNSIKGL